MTFALGPTFEQSAPVGFDIATYLAIKARLEKRHDKNRRPFADTAEGQSFAVFSRGWRGLLFQLICCAEDDSEFGDAVEAIRRHSGSIWQAQYRQERAARAFYRNSLLSIDCYCFAAFGLGAMLDPGLFLIESPRDLRNINIGSTVSAYRGLTGGSEMAEAVMYVESHTTYDKIRDTHNFLSHATLADRMLSTESIIDQLVSPGVLRHYQETTAGPLQWLIQDALNRLLKVTARIVTGLN